MRYKDNKTKQYVKYYFTFNLQAIDLQLNKIRKAAISDSLTLTKHYEDAALHRYLITTKVNK